MDIYPVFIPSDRPMLRLWHTRASYPSDLMKTTEGKMFAQGSQTNQILLKSEKVAFHFLPKVSSSVWLCVLLCVYESNCVRHTRSVGIDIHYIMIPG